MNVSAHSAEDMPVRASRMRRLPLPPAPEQFDKSNNPRDPVDLGGNFFNLLAPKAHTSIVHSFDVRIDVYHAVLYFGEGALYGIVYCLSCVVGFNERLCSVH